MWLLEISHCYAHLQEKRSSRTKGNTSVQLEGTKSTRNVILETCLVQSCNLREEKALRNVLYLKSQDTSKLMPVQFRKGPGSRFHAKQAAELGCFGHVVLVIESRREPE